MQRNRGSSPRNAAAGEFAIMAGMPTQPPLFGADPDRPQAPPPGDDAGAAAPDATVPAAAHATRSEDPQAPELPLPHPVRAAPARPVPASGGRPLWARLLGGLLDPWIRLDFAPGTPEPDGRPVCYVLEDYGLSNALILERACREAGLPSPLQPLPGDPLGRKRAYVALSRRNASALTPLQQLNAAPPPSKTHSGSLARLLDAHRDQPTLDVQLVPVSIFVGRAPDKSSGWFSVLFSENWTLVGRFRRLLAIALNGRDTLVRFSPPVSLRSIVDEGLPPERTVRKLSRVLRTHFRRIRAAVIGPDLSTQI